jgi:hypothetical protein
MAEPRENIAEIESRIAALRENVRQLVEQAAADSGAADDELISERIAQQEAQLQLLTKERDEMARLIRPQKWRSAAPRQSDGGADASDALADSGAPLQNQIAMMLSNTAQPTEEVGLHGQIGVA